MPSLREGSPQFFTGDGRAALILFPLLIAGVWLLEPSGKNPGDLKCGGVRNACAGCAAPGHRRLPTLSSWLAEHASGVVDTTAVARLSCQVARFE